MKRRRRPDSKSDLSFAEAMNRGAKLLEGGRPAEALPYLYQAASIRPDDVDAAVNLGGAHIMLGRYERAISILEEAAEREPMNSKVWINLGANVINSYSWEEVGVAEKYSDIPGYINSVTISELEPNESYYFICGANFGGWSNERRFDTPALKPKQILFVAGGDSQEGIEYRDNISRLMSSYNPEFVLYLGDAIENAWIQSEWDSWFQGIEDYWITEDDRIIPIIPCIGNHEANHPKFFSQ